MGVFDFVFTRLLGVDVSWDCFCMRGFSVIDGREREKESVWTLWDPWL